MTAPFSQGRLRAQWAVGPGVCLLYSHGLLKGQSWKTKHSPWSEGNTEVQRGDRAGIWDQFPAGTIEERPLLWDWPGFALGALAGPGGPLSLVGREAWRTGRLRLRDGLCPASPQSHRATVSLAQDFRRGGGCGNRHLGLGQQNPAHTLPLCHPVPR